VTREGTVKGERWKQWNQNQLGGEYVGVVVGVIGEGPLGLGPQALILGCAQLQLDYYSVLA